MAQYYSMVVRIEGFDPSRAEQIMTAAESQWPFSDWEHDEDRLESQAEDFLSIGEYDTEFVDRLSVAIWKANQEFCPIEVTSICQEYLPFDEYSRDENDYSRLVLKSEHAA